MSLSSSPRPTRTPSKGRSLSTGRGDTVPCRSAGDTVLDRTWTHPRDRWRAVAGVSRREWTGGPKGTPRQRSQGSPPGRRILYYRPRHRRGMSTEAAWRDGRALFERGGERLHRKGRRNGCRRRASTTGRSRRGGGGGRRRHRPARFVRSRQRRADGRWRDEDRRQILRDANGAVGTACRKVSSSSSCGPPIGHFQFPPCTSSRGASSLPRVMVVGCGLSRGGGGGGSNRIGNRYRICKMLTFPALVQL
mmetsp:Transcript_39391/g.76917  ORF Transcript_39391/g.76917 Transcript_39391/m.76917 type:complete len:249 (-) Transcript_39391:90-836(-)